MKTLTTPTSDQIILGQHWLIELVGCEASALRDVKTVESILRETAKAAKATIVESRFHQFSPHGVSGFVVVTESHLAIHTWPEHNYAAVDIFTCGQKMDMEAAYAEIVKAFAPVKHSKTEIARGYAMSDSI
jgi:S-adenosylmethionine decarboxylase proenzyme